MIDIENIKKYHQNLLSSEEAKKVEQALKEDENLRTMYEGYKAFISNHSESELKESVHNVNSRIHSRVNSLEGQELPIAADFDDSDIIEEHFRNKRKKKRASNHIKLAIAASIVLAIGITFLFMNPRTDTPIIADKPTDSTKDSLSNVDSQKTPVVVVDKDTAKEKEPNEVISLEEDDTPQLIAYNENPELELLVNNHVRSATEVGNIQPKNSKEFKKGETIEFSFIFSQEDEIELFILKSKGEVVNNIELQVKGTEVTGSFNTQEAGLYYWKLEGEDDLLYVGKFIVR